jgi:hypothetical protein
VASVASAATDRYIGRGRTGIAAADGFSQMRAEIEKLVEEIKQSVGLLRRHL